jgi:hypothetical protein
VLLPFFLLLFLQLNLIFLLLLSLDLLLIVLLLDLRYDADSKRLLRLLLLASLLWHYGLLCDQWLLGFLLLLLYLLSNFHP